NKQGSKKSGVANQRYGPKVISVLPARFHDRHREFRYRPHTFQIKSFDLVFAAGAIRGKQRKITRSAGTKNQSVGGAALLHHRLSEEREYSFGALRIRDQLGEFNEC